LADKTYFPINPPTMFDERDEVKCYDEPNPTEAWLSKRAELEAKKNQESKNAPE